MVTCSNRMHCLLYYALLRCLTHCHPLKFCSLVWLHCIYITIYIFFSEVCQCSSASDWLEQQGREQKNLVVIEMHSMLRGAMCLTLESRARTSPSHSQHQASVVCHTCLKGTVYWSRVRTLLARETILKLGYQASHLLQSERQGNRFLLL